MDALIRIDLRIRDLYSLTLYVDGCHHLQSDKLYMTPKFHYFPYNLHLCSLSNDPKADTCIYVCYHRRVSSLFLAKYKRKKA